MVAIAGRHTLLLTISSTYLFLHLHSLCVCTIVCTRITLRKTKRKYNIYILQQHILQQHKGKSQCPRHNRRYRCSGWGASPKCRPARRPVPARPLSLWTLQEHVGPTASTAGMAIPAVSLLALAVVVPAANLSVRRPV